MKSKKNFKVAIVGEGFFYFEGTNRVNREFCNIFPNADIYGLYGEKRILEKYFKGHRYRFSFLQKLPFVKKYYKYTYFLWPLAIESFDLSEYDLVISSSYSVAMGCIVPYPSKHISYIHTPMRYAWDLKDRYFNRENFSWWKRLVIPFFLVYLHIWDVCASQRPDILIANSEFVSRRMYKYWKRRSDFVIHPPVDLYKGKIKGKRKNYFVTGMNSEPNKNGKILLEYARELNINLKIVGRYSWREKFKYRKYKSIEFLGFVSEKEKFKILSNAKGYITLGIEDFGIFPVEAMSCGTPVLYYKKGGVQESVKEGKTGFGIEELKKEKFRSVLQRFENMKWNYKYISKYAKRFDRGNFKKQMENVIDGLLEKWE